MDSDRNSMKLFEQTWCLPTGILIQAFLVVQSAFAQSAEFGSDPFVISRFPLPGAVRSVSRQQTGDPFSPGTKIIPGNLKCLGDVLEAATPGQYTKKYHVDAILYYDQSKVPGTRAVAVDPPFADLPGNFISKQVLCTLPQKSESLNPATQDKWCQMAKVGRYTMMSDLFFCRVDGGADIKYYRAYWESAAIWRGFNRSNPMQTFRAENEHVMTMSLARGDSMPEDKDGNPQFTPGDTFGEQKTRFLFVTEATPQEIVEISKAIAQQTGQSGAYEKCQDMTFRARSGKASRCPK